MSSRLYNIDKKKNEVNTNNGIVPINPNLYDVCHSICRILNSNKNKISSGFLIKIHSKDKPLFCLMTNGHTITEEMIKNNDKIDVYYDNQKERIQIHLNIKDRFIQNFNDLDLDCSVVEILPNDNVDGKYFLLPNIDYNDSNYKSLNNKKIYIVQFPEGKDLSHSSGNIKNINKYELTHEASTEPGSQGSPIFLDQTNKVIGIQGGDNKQNFGDFIFPIIKILNNIKIEDIKKKHSNEKNEKPLNKDMSDTSNIDNLIENILINEFKFTKDLLYSELNATNWGNKGKKGGFDYNPPNGWIGIGLNVLGKYDNGNDDWVKDNGNKNEWAVSYHNTKGIYLKSIVTNGFKIGQSQSYKDSNDIYHSGQKVGTGIYFNNDLKLMEYFAKLQSFDFYGKKFMAALMVRVKPDKIRSPSSSPNFWVLNPTSDEIRPYRILLKEVKDK